MTRIARTSGDVTSSREAVAQHPLSQVVRQDLPPSKNVQLAAFGQHDSTVAHDWQ